MKARTTGAVFSGRSVTDSSPAANVYISLRTMSVAVPDRAREQLGRLEDRRTDLAKPVAGEDLGASVAPGSARRQRLRAGCPSCPAGLGSVPPSGAWYRDRVTACRLSRLVAGALAIAFSAPRSPNTARRRIPRANRTTILPRFRHGPSRDRSCCLRAVGRGRAAGPAVVGAGVRGRGHGRDPGRERLGEGGPRGRCDPSVVPARRAR